MGKETDLFIFFNMIFDNFFSTIFEYKSNTFLEHFTKSINEQTQRQMASDVKFHSEHTKSSSSSMSLPPSNTIINPSISPISPLQPIYQIDSMVNVIGESNNGGGIFLFETERHLVHTNKYTCTLYTVCIFGCWVCTIPSIIATIYARIAAQKNQMVRAKVLFNIAFILSFLGLILFAIQAGYLTWLIRYLLHRFITQ
jgi:hypothetical protein